MLRPVENDNPAFVRRELQTRYDSYMSGHRLRLGLILPRVTLETMGSNKSERKQAYSDLADRFPKKTRRLITAVAKELLFEESSAKSHDRHVNELAFDLAKKAGEGYTVGYISGLGRNACRYTLLRTEVGGISVLPVIMRGGSEEFDFVNKAMPVDGLIIDPDFQLGGMTGPTPDVFGIEGNEDLAYSVFKNFDEEADQLTIESPLLN